MRIAFTFHNLEPSEPLRAYAEEKLSKLEKYMHGTMNVLVHSPVGGAGR